MSSLKKIETARANGAKSHGPKTEECKRRSSRHALKHGLYARHGPRATSFSDPILLNLY